MTIFGMDYQTFWAVIFAIVAVFAFVPLYGIWIELRRWRQANRGSRPDNITYSYPRSHDDKYDKQVR